MGNPNRVDKQGRKLAPRQIIVRVNDTAVKRHILSSSKYLKVQPTYEYITINEDLTKRRNVLAYMACKLKETGWIHQSDVDNRWKHSNERQEK